MFRHTKGLPLRARPGRGDAALAMALQELMGGPRGMMTGAMQALMQAWNCRGPAKYRHMLLDIGTEKLGHVEMLACMVGQLLDGSTPDPAAPWRARGSQGAGRGNGAGTANGTATNGGSAGAVSAAHGAQPVAGVQQLLVSGLGPMLADGRGEAWTAAGVVATGNLMADLRANMALESHGRLMAARLLGMTTDAGVREVLGLLMARHGAHQNQWLAAMEELHADGLEDVIVPGAAAGGHWNEEVGHQYWNLSEEGQSRVGRWARGPTPDGRGRFEVTSEPATWGPEAELPPPDPRLFLTDPRQRPAPPGGVRQQDRHRAPIGAAMRGEL